MPNLIPPQPAHSRVLNRRSALQIGASSAVGLSLLSSVRAEGNSLQPKAKSIIIVFLTGAASHHDTFDMKLDAPAEIRGEFNRSRLRFPDIRSANICRSSPRWRTGMP
jgi:hypothetical protein